MRNQMRSNFEIPQMKGLQSGAFLDPVGAISPSGPAPISKLLSPADLRAHCLVNKDLRNHIEPFLYANIRWAWLEGPPPPVTLLLRTLLRRPQLATYITNVHLDGHTFYRQKLRVPYGDLWIQELCHGTMDAWVALLLAQLSSVRCLYLGPNFTQQSTIIGMVLRSAICEPGYKLPDFQHLRDVTFHLHVGDYLKRDRTAENTAGALSFFYLSSVQRMSVSIENPVTWPAAHLPISSTLVSLDSTSIREAYLGEILSVTPNLETLRWAWYFDSGVEDQYTTPIVHLDQISTALSHVRDTLTDLIISADCALGGNDQFLPAIKTEGSLHALANSNMPKLKRLEIPFPFPVGFAQDTTKRLQDVVPRNFNDDVTDHQGLLETWLEDRRWIDSDLDGWHPEMRRQLRDLGVRAGVEIGIVELPGYG
ncbi:uncharacterized protein BO80DRAFT_489702 [Aspergillus ibericus CBS 121593]|uniref:Uncharacterized protein n=1 Tax=Aspergillus ibericus CBS 121593 TaxID=1448316 RepID=A0A395HGR3_9EURO|nr:hypothetical protein BO80DRAFT_489702 [Aspergillus ibericus CBS 121593]RAL06168.1 hypothetical protein BO80DRAFT_489702 [Aspergillus ibericus CBS 121593]